MRMMTPAMNGLTRHAQILMIALFKLVMMLLAPPTFIVMQVFAKFKEWMDLVVLAQHSA